MAATVVAALLMAPVSARGADPLAVPVAALWTAVPLRDWAARVTVIAGRPVVVDRRLDPDATISRDCRDEPLGEVLAAAAASVGATVEPLGAWIRLAPAATAGRAVRGERARAGEIAALPAATRSALAARRRWSWPDGARPRDLVSAAASDAHVTVAGIDAVPHDHLPAADLAPLTLPERLDVLLAHYDLRVAWSTAAGRTIATVVPLEEAPAPAAAAEARRAAPRARGEPRASRSPGAERYTLRLEAPLDEALAALAARMGLEAEIDRGALADRGILPGEIVRATVADATRAELLDAVVGPLGLRWRIEGRRLIVTAPATP